MRSKNQIFKYYIFNLKELIKLICKQLINKKPPNLVGN